MEFNKKLQELRKQKNITQEQLANELFVSRTAISKWESGRGLPSIDSLKAIAVFFEVTVDDLLSSNELLFLAQEDSRQTKSHSVDIVFGLLDTCSLLLLFLPFFAQRIDGELYELSLLNLTLISPYLRLIFLVLVCLLTLCGTLTLVLQNCTNSIWLMLKSKLSLILSTITVLVFVLCLQPYPAIFILTFLAIKILIKKY